MQTITGSRIRKMSPLLMVTDLGRAIEFYTNTLGFELGFVYEDFYAGILKDGFSIHLKTGDHSAEERKRRRANEDLDIVFSVEGVEQLFEEISGKSADIVQSLRQMPYGREFYVADPDGYIIAFIEEVGSGDV